MVPTARVGWLNKISCAQKAACDPQKRAREERDRSRSKNRRRRASPDLVQSGGPQGRLSWESGQGAVDTGGDASAGGEKPPARHILVSLGGESRSRAHHARRCQSPARFDKRARTTHTHAHTDAHGIARAHARKHTHMLMHTHARARARAHARTHRRCSTTSTPSATT